MVQKTQEERDGEFTLNYAYAMCDRSQQADRQFGHTSQCQRPEASVSTFRERMTVDTLSDRDKSKARHGKDKDTDTGRDREEVEAEGRN